MEAQATGTEETPAVISGKRGSFGRIHLYKAEPVENEWGGREVMTLCGIGGFASVVDLSQDPREICARCAWKEPGVQQVGEV